MLSYRPRLETCWSGLKAEMAIGVVIGTHVLCGVDAAANQSLSQNREGKRIHTLNNRPCSRTTLCIHSFYAACPSPVTSLHILLRPTSSPIRTKLFLLRRCQGIECILKFWLRRRVVEELDKICLCFIVALAACVRLLLCKRHEFRFC
jgi:hypothetical protein